MITTNSSFLRLADMLEKEGRAVPDYPGAEADPVKAYVINAIAKTLREWVETTSSGKV